MQPVIIVAFDIDGTLRCDCRADCLDVRPEVVALLKAFKVVRNLRVIAWSSRGEDYCKGKIVSLGLTELIPLTSCFDKASNQRATISVDDDVMFNKCLVALVVK